jgi:hypothetical protein
MRYSSVLDNKLVISRYCAGGCKTLSDYVRLRVSATGISSFNFSEASAALARQPWWHNLQTKDDFLIVAGSIFSQQWQLAFKSSNDGSSIRPNQKQAVG